MNLTSRGGDVVVAAYKRHFLIQLAERGTGRKQVFVDTRRRVVVGLKGFIASATEVWASNTGPVERSRFGVAFVPLARRNIGALRRSIDTLIEQRVRRVDGFDVGSGCGFRPDLGGGGVRRSPTHGAEQGDIAEGHPRPPGAGQRRRGDRLRPRLLGDGEVVGQVVALPTGNSVPEGSSTWPRRPGCRHISSSGTMPSFGTCRSRTRP